jgi:parallel beta-helix repeat protein
MIAGMSFPTTPVSTDSHSVIAQDTGYRPTTLTPHVPIEINGIADFISQGWPGAGTSGNPYVIAGLNITEDSGMYLIHIENVHASFVIRDCLLSQGATTLAVYIANTTSAKIEYTTIDSAMGGAYCYNSNNTLFDHNDISSGALSHDYAIRLSLSSDCTFNGNAFRSNYRGVYTHYSPNLAFTNNLFDGSDSYFSYYLEYSNHTTITGDTIKTGYSCDLVNSYFVTITNMHNTGRGGIQSSNGGTLNINSCTLDSNTGPAILISNTPNVDISDSYIAAPGSYGVTIANSENLTFTGNTVKNINDYGIQITSSDNVVISGNSIDDTGSYGFQAQTSDFMTFNQNSVTNAQGIGIDINSCTNGTLTNSVVKNTQNDAIQLSSAPNWTIADNAITQAVGWGIYHDTGNSVVIARNTISHASSGIYVSSAENATISDNHITDASSSGTGMQVQYSFQAEILRNTIDRAYDGILCTGCDNATIEANAIAKVIDLGIQLENMNYVLVKSNTITDGPSFGIYMTSSHTNEYIDNSLEGCGFFFDTTVLGWLYHVIQDNTVNGLPIYYVPDVSNQDIHASSYGQILLVNNTHMNVHDGIFGLASDPIEAAFSTNCNFQNIDTSGNIIGMVFISCENTTVQNYIHHGRNSVSGILALDVGNISIQQADITGCRYGVLGDTFGAFYGNVVNNLLIDNSNFDDNDQGVFIDLGTDIMVSHSQITNTAEYAFYISDTSSNYIRVLDNVILNATYGLYSAGAYNWTIMDNTIMYCSSAAVYATGSTADYLNITLNVLENNRDGIYVTNGDLESITNNSIRWNSRYGVYLTGSAGTQVYYNTIALNRVDNGYDSTAGNYWDDGAVLGNSWDDYTPPGTYAVDGDTTDRYPEQYAPTTPVISQPQDIYYAEGSEGNEITWYAFGDSLRDWKVNIDGSLWKGDAWNFNNVAVNVDGLAYGTHTVVITLWDVNQHSVQDTVLVHVYDGTPPTISNTPNTEAFVTGSGQTLSWKVSDLHPATYSVFLDGDAWKSGSWTTGILQINIDGMTEGEHTLVMTIFDLDGNQASDSVTVVVINDQVSPTINSPADFSYTAGTTGNVIVWNASDQYPSHYQVTYNGSVFAEGSWAGSRIVVNVDGLAPGSYTFQITVYDGASNSAQDSVTVTVVQAATQTQPPAPLDIGTLLLIAGVAGAIVVVIVVVYFLKKRR